VGGEGVGSPYNAKGGEEGAHATVDTRYLDYVESTMGYRATFFTFVSKNKAILIENYVVCAL
jgi:hypothetical protein